MKKILLSLFIISKTYSIEGIIKVFNAPIYTEDRLSEQVSEFKKMGKKIFIDDKSLKNPYFFKTIQNDGTFGFIPKKYVKIIYKDKREFSEKISLKKDPTHYINKEDLLRDNPFAKKYQDNRKIAILFNYDQPNNSSYKYPFLVNQQYKTNPTSLQIQYLVKKKIKYNDSLYYGFHLGGKSGLNEFLSSENHFAKELHLSIFTGPMINYTFLKKKNFRIEFNLKIAINYERYFITLENKSRSEEVMFSGFNISSSFSTSFIYYRPFKTNNINLFYAPIINFYLPSRLSLKTQYTTSHETWTDKYYHILGRITLGHLIGLYTTF